MRGSRQSHGTRKTRTAAAATIAALLLAGGPLLPGAAAAAQRGNERKGAEENSIASPIPIADDRAIDVLISQVLGAWQIGDVEMMRGHHDAGVVVVSGAWEPPLVGWDAYLKAYQAQRARTQSARLERRNTVIKVSGDSAWATYQWEFNGIVDGAPTSAVGHTTLVLERRAGKWLIVLNHTSTPPLPQANATEATSQR